MALHLLLVTLFLASHCQGLSPVYRGVHVDPVSYSMPDGSEWNSSSAVVREQSSDTLYSGLRNASGFLSGGLGKLTDDVLGGSSSNNTAWIQWNTADLRIDFTFPHNMSLCQIDIFLRSEEPQNLNAEVYYDTTSTRNSWGAAQIIDAESEAAAKSSTGLGVSIPRRTHPRITATRTTRHVIIIFRDRFPPQDLYLSEVKFWECPCEQGWYPIGCVGNGIFSILPAPCEDANPAPSCIADSTATCHNQYCSQIPNGTCAAQFSQPNGLRAVCTTPPSVSTSTQTTVSSSPGQTKSANITVYLAVIGGLVFIAVIAIALLILRCHHYRKANKHLKITTAAIMSDGKYSAATLSRHFVHFNTTTTTANGHVSGRGSPATRSAGSNGVMYEHYKVPRTTNSGTAISLDHYKSPDLSSSSSATNSTVSFNGPDDYVNMRKTSAQAEVSLDYEPMRKSVSSETSQSGSKKQPSTSGLPAGASSSARNSAEHTSEPVARRLEF